MKALEFLLAWVFIACFFAIGLGILLHALVLVGCFLAWSWHPMLSMWASFMTDVWFSVRICVFVTGFLAIFPTSEIFMDTK